jgi:autotransporter-associated beta strand protein
MNTVKPQIVNTAVRLLVCLGLLTASAAFAQTTRVWTNSAGDRVLSTAVNWNPNGTPATGDTLQWNGIAAGDLLLTNTGTADSSPGLNIDVLAGQTGALTIVEALGNANRIRLNTRFYVTNGAGAVTFGSSSTPALPIALGAGGNGAVHGWTNNSANLVTINTNVYFVMGGGGTHTLITAGTGNFIFNNTIQPNNGAGLNLTVSGPGSTTVMGIYTPGITWAAGSAYAQTILNGGTLICGGNNAIGTNNFTINGGSLDSVAVGLTNLLIASQNWNGNFTFNGSQSLNLGAGPVALNASRIVTVNASTLAVDGPISGSGFSLTKAGAGTLVLNNANTYSGGTVISNGVLTMGVVGALTNAGNVTVHGTLDVNGNSPTLINLSGTGIVDTLSGGTPLLTLSNNAGSTFSGVIRNSSGTVAVTKNGSGALTLGGANTYAGNTTVSAGTLLINGSTAGSSAVTVASGATLGGTNLIGGSVNWQSGSSGLFTVNPTAAVAGSNATPLTVSSSVTLNGNVVTVNVGGATPLGAGIYKLMSYNTGGSSGAFSTASPSYTGAGVAPGTVSSIATSGGAVTLTVIFTGVTATWTNNGNGNWSTGADWSSNPYYPHLSGDVATLGVGSAYTTVTLDANVSLAAVVLTNANSFLVADAGKTLNFANAYGSGLITVNAGSSNAIATAVTLNTNLTIAPVSGTSLAITNTISNGSAVQNLTVNGAGTVSLSGVNTYGPASAGTVGTTLGGGGTLQLGNNNAIGSGDVSVSSSGTLRAGAAFALANNIIAGSGATATVDNNGNNVTLSGIVSGAGALAKNGTGTLTLNSANTYGNGFSISAGTVKLGDAGGIPGGVGFGNVNMGTNTTLDMNGFNVVLNGLNASSNSAVVDSLSGGAVTLTLGENGAFATYAGSIKNTAGSLSLVKDGAGTQTLSGTNTYIGTTTINAGTLQIGNGGTSGSLGSGSLTDNGVLSFNLIGTNVFAGAINGSGGVVLNNASLSLWLTGNNGFTGGITNNGGALWITNANQVGSASVVQVASPNSSLHLDGSLGNIALSSATTFYLSGSTGVLTNDAGTNTITGSVMMPNGNGNPYIVVNNGSLELAGSVSTVAGNNNRALTLGGAGNGLVSGNIVEAGPQASVTKQDAGTWTLTGSGNTYTGPTTVSAGTLAINGNNSGNGAIAVNGGTLLVNGNNFGSGAVTVATNATLGGVGTIYSAITWQTGAKGTFTASASGSTPLTIYGNVTLNNNPLTVFVDGGTPLPPGSYTLLYQGNIISSITGSFATTPIITGAGVQPGTKYFVAKTATSVVLIVAPNDVWISNANGNWTTGANWDSNPNYPSSAGQIATLGFGSSLITVNLNASQTIGGIAFTNNNSFAITNANNVLALDNTGNGASVSVTGGTANSIATGILLNDATTVTTATGTSLVVSGNVGGSGNLAVTGNGVMSLSGSNLYSGTTTLSGGTLVLGSTNAVGSGSLTISGGALDSSVVNLVNLNNNAQTWNGSFAFLGSQNLNLGSGAVSLPNSITLTVSSNQLTVPGAISGAGLLTFSNAGPAVLELDAANSFSGGFTAIGGPTNSPTVIVGNDTAFGTGTLNLTPVNGLGITLRTSDSNPRTIANSMSVNAFDGPYIFAGPGNWNFTSTNLNGNGQKRFFVTNTTVTWSGPFTDGGSPSGPFIKDGSGTLVMSGSNSALLKPITVNAGTLALGSTNGIGKGTLTMSGGALDSTVASLVNLGNNPQSWTANFGFAGSQNLNLGTGSVTMNANCTITTTNNTLAVGGAVSGTGALTKAGSGKLVLSGANAYAGSTTVNAGTLEVAQATLATNASVTIASGAVLQLDFSVTNKVSGLVLNGVSQPLGVYGSSTPGGYITGTGFLQVVQYGPSGPARLTNSVSGSTLSLSWPANEGWRLQMQTNSLSVGLKTNWVYISDGTTSSTNITIDATKPTVFYRLTYP